MQNVMATLNKLSLRQRVRLELAVLALLTMAFLWWFPQRPMWVNALLALFALALVAANWRYTREVVWQAHAIEDNAQAQAWRITIIATGIIIAALLVTGITLGYLQSGWSGVWTRFTNPNALLALGVYLPWAIVQQTLFQVYLLGRLLAVMPTAVAITITGVAYSLVHSPDWTIVIVTAGTGVLWSTLYYRYRTLLPLALSHAALGTAFYYWVYGKDLFLSWQQGLS